MHWVYKSRAIYNLGVALKNKGWAALGLSHGESDPMTDYFVPPSWDGVAVKDNFIICVDLGPTPAKDYSKKLQAKVLPTPNGKSWHLQDKEGHIVASGVGLAPCSRYGREGEKAAELLADKIIAKAEKPQAGRLPGVEREGNFTWIKFRDKPSQDVLSELKAAGWRFSWRRQAWYHPHGAEPPQIALEFLGKEGAE